MSDVTKFCVKTLNKVSKEIQKIKTELNANFDTNERNEILPALEKNDELNRKHLQERIS